MQLSSDYELVTATSFEEIEVIRPIWEQMQRSEPYPVPNADIDRYLSVVRASGEGVQPYVMLVRDNGCPAAMVIGRIEKHQFKCKIGYWTICNPRLRCLSVIYGGISGQPSSDACAQIVQHLQEILKQRVVDAVFLNQVRTDSNIHETVREATGPLCRNHYQKSQQHWQTLIPYPLNGFKGIISKKHLHDIQRCIRNLEKVYSGPVEVVCYSQKEDIDEFVKVSSRILALTYQGQIDEVSIADPVTRALLKQAQEDGWLRAYVLYAGREPIAFEFGCVHGDSYFAETAGFDPRWKAYGPGTILQLKIFERLSRDDKVLKYDYGFGDATYKQRFGTVSWPEVSVYIFAPRLHPLLVNATQSFVMGMNRGLGYFANKIGSVGWMKRRWRNVLEKSSKNSHGVRMTRDTLLIPKTDFDITTVRTLDEVECIRNEWEQIQQNEPFAVPNADVRRYVAGMKALGDDAEPYIVLVKLNGRPAAMVIGRIERRPIVFKRGYKMVSRPALRCLSIVYGGIIGQPSRDLCTLLLNELTNALRHREADMVFFNHLRTDSPISQLCETMLHFMTRSHCVLAEPHWQTDIPETVDEFYGRIPKSRKQRWYRDIRNIEKMSSSGIKVVCYRDIKDVGYLIDVVCHIEKSTYKNGLNIGFTNSVLNRALLEQAARDDWLRAYVLYVSGEPCAFQLDIRYGKTQFTEYGSFNPRWEHGSPGIVLLLKVLEELCGDPEICAMDYGFGDAGYKAKLGTNYLLEKSAYIYAPRLRPVAVNMTASANLAFSRVLRWTAANLHLDSSIKRYWRRMARGSGQKVDAGKKVT